MDRSRRRLIVVVAVAKQARLEASRWHSDDRLEPAHQ